MVDMVVLINIRIPNLLVVVFLIDDLCRLELDNQFSKSLLTMHQSIGIKCNLLNEISTYL